MKRFVCAVLALAFVSLTAPADTSAQAALFVGAGAALPTGDFSDFGGGDGANLGWQATVGFGVPVGDAGLQIGGRGFYGSNNHDTDGDKTNLLGGTGLASFAFGDPGTVAPFIYGEAGYLKHSYKSESFPAAEGSSSGLIVGGGAGVNVPVGGLDGFLVAGYTLGTGDVDGTTFFGVTAGVNIPLGGGGM